MKTKNNHLHTLGLGYARFWQGMIAAILLQAHPTMAQKQSDGSGVQIFGAVDIVGQSQIGGDKEPIPAGQDQLRARGVELSLFGPIDPYFSGLLSLAAHGSGEGIAPVELHEAYIVNSGYLPGTRIRMGQFFLPIGRLNQFHQHDWPFISTPLVHRQVVNGDEGVIDTGMEATTLLPLPFVLEWTLGVSNGYTYGHSHDGGEKPIVPTHYSRLMNHLDLTDSTGLQNGVTYLQRQQADGMQMRLLGWDMTAKVRHGKQLSFLWQSELWHRHLQPEQGNSESSLGAYAYPQIALSQQTYLGLRGDYLTNLTLKNALGSKIANHEIQWEPTLTFKPSEFSQLRVAYQNYQRQLPGLKDAKQQHFLFQSTFILGAHPSHDF
jgi:hypothetical protein